ncbi:hypothetical protein C0Q70_09519 [Pomacea canaliculata]|uniref:Uncharacterized protein n=1 Tax=Pomacea canaliculata TaxID=400727 RepID=A0A2T7PA27_POMCA|nr:hypothetical protein C0Q70_09519 [Pomacea canaliculata]
MAADLRGDFLMPSSRRPVRAFSGDKREDLTEAIHGEISLHPTTQRQRNTFGGKNTREPGLERERESAREKIG